MRVSSLFLSLAASWTPDKRKIIDSAVASSIMETLIVGGRLMSAEFHKFRQNMREIGERWRYANNAESIA